MFKKIKDFLFGKPVTAAPVAWAEAKDLADALKEVAIVKDESTITVADPSPANTVEVTLKTPRKPRVKVTQESWPFPVEKPSEGVTTAEFQALKIDPPAPAAMKARKPRKVAVVPKQD